MFLVLNAVFITVYHVKAVQDDIFVKTVPTWLHHTVGGECIVVYEDIFNNNGSANLIR